MDEIHKAIQDTREVSKVREQKGGGVGWEEGGGRMCGPPFALSGRGPPIYIPATHIVPLRGAMRAWKGGSVGGGGPPPCPFRARTCHSHICHTPTRSCLQSEDLEKIKASVQALSKASMKIGETLAQQSGSSGGGSSSSSDSSSSGGSSGGSGSGGGEKK